MGDPLGKLGAYLDPLFWTKIQVFVTPGGYPPLAMTCSSSKVGGGGSWYRGGSRTAIAVNLPQAPTERSGQHGYPYTRQKETTKKREKRKERKKKNKRNKNPDTLFLLSIVNLSIVSLVPNPFPGWGVTPPKGGYPPPPRHPPRGGGVQEIQGSLRTPPTKRPIPMPF